jgi:hypothetical protein
MNEIKHLLELAVDDVAVPTPDQIGADVARGRRALRWRRTVQSLFAAAAMTAVVIAVPQVVQRPWADPPAPAAPPSATSTPTATERTTADVYRTFVAALERYAVPVQGRVKPLTGNRLGPGAGPFLLPSLNQPGAQVNGTLAEVPGGGSISLMVMRAAAPLSLDGLCDQYREPLAECEQEVLDDGAVLVTAAISGTRITTLVDGRSLVEVTSSANWNGVMTPGTKLEPPISAEIQRRIVTDPGLRW